jgi:CheY-like chemotaxis protein
MELESVSFELAGVVGDATQVLAVRAAQKGLELAYHVDPLIPPSLLGDPGRLRQIIINLVGNAIKFTERGEVLVRVWMEGKTSDRVQLHCTVQDTGIGIPLDKRQTIFEPFKQADLSTTRRFGGTGLGLAISSKLVRLMNGEIWVDSEVGRGSTFHFTVKLGLAEAAASASFVDYSLLRDVTLMLVDDNASCRRFLCESFSAYHLQTTAVAGEPEAIDALVRAADAATPLQVVILDGTLNGEDALPVVERIRHTPRFGEHPIIVLLPADNPDQLLRYRQLSNVQCLAKPAKYAELLDAILCAIGAPCPRRSSFGDRDSETEFRPLRILLAEDGPINQEVAVGLLKIRGHSVDVVENGRLAVETLDRDPSYDAVLMDLEMPEMDGLEATRIIRDKERISGDHIPVIAMTAHAVKGFREKCMEVGMDGYITKPVEPEEMFRTVETAVARIERTPVLC